MDIAIIGGGIVGLGLAMQLHKRGIASTVYEAAPEVKELGVGITVLPHAMRELSALGLQEQLEPQGIVNEWSCFYTRHGQLIYREQRGRAAGYRYPEVGMHRGRLHNTMWRAATERLGAERVRTDHKCVGFTQDEQGVSLNFVQTSTGAARPPVRADLAIACDGVNSTIRQQLYPGEKVVFTGINTWRGVTKHRPILGGRSYIRAGSIKTGKIVIYPIIDDVDGQGNQLINWTTEVTTDPLDMNDWNKPGRAEDTLKWFETWTFDWCNVPELIRKSDVIFEYPMVDKDPVDQWTFGRMTLAGDAAHPMYPRGSNGSAQGMVDSRVLADALAADLGPGGLRAYEAERVPKAANVVRTNRSTPPDYINIKVEELTNDQPFDNLDKFISQDELRAMSDHYKAVAGFTVQELT
jgi:2-polyprenyl-6-methoxyphenol hydroxylase-like FAD-dependent oxidoreductase